MEKATQFNNLNLLESSRIDLVIIAADRLAWNDMTVWVITNDKATAFCRLLS
jgi:hypothetical protein